MKEASGSAAAKQFTKSQQQKPKQQTTPANDFQKSLAALKNKFSN
jgi:hypothetical protein